MSLGLLLRRLRIALIVAPLVALAGGCTGKPPFMIVQLCVVDEEGVVLFKSLMQDIAQSEEMEFQDASEKTERELKELAESGVRHLETDGIVFIGVHGRGFGLSAANMGLRKYQIAIGFSEASRPAESEAFAQRVIGSLKRHWPVEKIPTGKGAVPMRECGE